MTPPPRGHVGPAPPMPSALHVMMQEMQRRQPKFQQQMQQAAIHQGGRGRGGRYGGRHGGRGQGRKGLQHGNDRRTQRDDQLQSKRKRGPSDEGRDTSRFFLPSFLEDPWKALETGGDAHKREDRYRRQVESNPADDGLGRVLFQPGFLEDPWGR